MFASPEERVGEAYFIMYIVYLVITVTNRIGSVFVSRLYSGYSICSILRSPYEATLKYSMLFFVSPNCNRTVNKYV